MTSEERLASIIEALEGVGLRCLVLGGHAARIHGLGRTTNDHLSARQRGPAHSGASVRPWRSSDAPQA